MVAGDIAFSGLSDEYKLAKSFFLTLIPALRQEFNGVEPRIVFVPGNHDCDLKAQNDIRHAGLAPAQAAQLDPAGGFAREFLAVQGAFWDFASELGHPCNTTTERLYARRVITTSTNASIAFTCINSAWVSTNPEMPGSLLFPYTIHKAIEDFTADMEVTTIHHPPHWLQPEHARVLRDAIEKRADLVITGHEHRHEAFTKLNTDVNLNYIAGRAMYDKSSEETGFNAITVDLSSKHWSVLGLIWDGSRYASTGQPTDTEIIERIVANATQIFATFQPSTLEDSAVHELNRAALSPPQAVALLSEDTDKNRRELRQKLDEFEEQAIKQYNSGEKVAYDESLPDLAKLTIAFKTIHILGQVLRSFPGDIRKELKVRIAESCYLLGLRVLGMALQTINANTDYLRTYFTALLLERQIEGSAAMLGGAATKAVLELAVLWTYAVVKTLAHAVGMEELSETYKEVMRAHGEMLSAQIVDTSIKLDYFGIFPDASLQRLHKRTRDSNYIAFCAIRNLLLTHFNLFKTTHVVRARFASLYNINLAATKFVEGGLTKLIDSPKTE